MSTVALFRFEGAHQVRTLDVDGRRWAVAADICAALDIKNSRDSLSRLDEADKLVMRRSDTVGSTDSIWSAFAPQVQSIGLVSEDGATDLVLDSRKPEARRFRRWLTHEVWPTIRETGSYSTAPALTGPALVAAALIEANRMLEAKDERIAELEPKAEVADRILDAEGDLSVRDAAQSLTRAGIKVGERRLFSALAVKGWIQRAMGDGRYRVRQSAIEAGYMSVLPQSHYHPRTGVLVLDPPQPRVTPKGLQKLLIESGAEA